MADSPTRRAAVGVRAAQSPQSEPADLDHHRRRPQGEDGAPQLGDHRFGRFWAVGRLLASRALLGGGPDGGEGPALSLGLLGGRGHRPGQPLGGGAPPDVTDAPTRGRRRHRPAWGSPPAAGSGSPSAPIWALSARPEPVIAAFTSLGVCSATGMSFRAATSMATPAACAVPITVWTLCWAKTRSTATRSGRCRSIQSWKARSSRTSRCGTSAWRRCGPRRPRPAPADVRGCCRPHRTRTGSAPGRCPARARPPLTSSSNNCSILGVRRRTTARAATPQARVSPLPIAPIEMSSRPSALGAIAGGTGAMTNSGARDQTQSGREGAAQPVADHTRGRRRSSQVHRTTCRPWSRMASSL